MSNTRYPWWGYARKIIYLYPERCRQHQEMLRQNITPGYCEQVGGHTASRTVEQITVKAMTASEYREYKAVYDAIAVKGNPELMRLLTLLYWQKHILKPFKVGVLVKNKKAIDAAIAEAFRKYAKPNPDKVLVKTKKVKKSGEKSGSTEKRD